MRFHLLKGFILKLISYKMVAVAIADLSSSFLQLTFECSDDKARVLLEFEHEAL